MKNPFDKFDKIVCVCAKHETERWNHAVTQFKEIGIYDRVEKFDEVINQDWVNSTFGKGWNRTDYCHYKIILDAHEEELNNVFIFESDIDFINTDLELMQKSIDTLNDIDWKLFFMGGVPHMVYDIVNEHLVNVSMCQAHAYAVNGKYCKEVSDILKNNRMPIDQVYKRGKKFDLAKGSYSTHPRFVVQEDPELQTRKQYSAIMWKKLIEPMMDMHNRGVKLVLGSDGKEGKMHRIITSNCKQSLDNIGINASDGFVQIHEMEFSNKYEKLDTIKSVLDKEMICFYSDSDNIFLENPIDYLLEQLTEYDVIVQTTGKERTECVQFEEILNVGFCLVKPNELTKKLFDSSESVEFVYNDDSRDEQKYFNSKLNLTELYKKGLKIKILDKNEFPSLSYYKDNKQNIKPFIVTYNLDFKGDVHPRTKLKEIRKMKHYFLRDKEDGDIRVWKCKLNDKLESVTFSMMPQNRRNMHTMILNNMCESINKTEMFDANEFVELESVSFKSNYEKLELIHGILKQGKSCLYIDPDIVFLKNPLEYLHSEIQSNDLIIQYHAQTNRKLKYYRKVVNPGFCFVKPNDLTLKLFDTSEDCDLLYSDCREDIVYFNSKLNSTDCYYNNLKMKILDEDEFCISYEGGDKKQLNENDPYMIHFAEYTDRIFHPKNKIGRMQEYNLWTEEDE
jgi:hypothetical protein